MEETESTQENLVKLVRKQHKLTPLPLDLTITTALFKSNTIVILYAQPQFNLPTSLLNTSINVFLPHTVDHNLSPSVMNLDGT